MIHNLVSQTHLTDVTTATSLAYEKCCLKIHCYIIYMMFFKKDIVTVFIHTLGIHIELQNSS